MRWLSWQRKGFWLLLIVSIAFNVGFGSTFGVRGYQHYGRQGGHGDSNSFRTIHEILNLTPEQEARMTAAREELLRQVDELRREVRVETDALANLVTTPEPDRAVIRPQLDKVGALRQQIQHQVVEHFLKMKKLLLSGQRDTFDEIIRRHIFHDSALGHGSENSRGHGSQHSQGHGTKTGTRVFGHGPWSRV